jgi:signal transduction histidine kinase
LDPASGSWSASEPERPKISAEALRWFMGFFCSFLGSLVLVAPHRFTAPFVLDLYSGWWGASALLSGVALLAVAAFRPRPPARLLAHALAGGTLLALAASFASAGIWIAVSAYIVLGVGTALAGFLPARRAAPERDLFAILMGAVAALNGVSLIAWPGLQASPYFDRSRPYLGELGAFLFLSGGFLLLVHTRRARSSRLLWTAHLSAGAAFFTFGLAVSLQQRAWTALAVNWGYSVALGLLPWWSRRLARLDTASLRTRLSFILATATSVALILATAVVTAQEERLAEEQALATQRIEARAIAQNVSDYVEMNGARTFAVAALAGRVPLTPERQAWLLAASRRSYPDVTAFRTVAADGRVVAAAGTVSLPLRLLRALMAEMRRERNPRLQLIPATVGAQSLLLLGAPVRGDGGGLSGMLVAAFDSTALARRIGRAGSAVSLSDGRGRLIASRNQVLPGEEVARLPEGWDVRIRDGRRVARPGSVAGFAVESGLGWVVAAERPRADALAGVRRGRDLAFGLLLVVIPMAVVGGILVARRIARPLDDLSTAVGELTAGNLAAPIGASSGVTEVAGLAGAFREMRDRLAERTRESERLAAELRARAEALAEIDRRKDEFLAMLAHELRNPLGAIANASYLLEELGTAGAQADRAVAIIRRQIQHLVRMVDDLLDVSRITRGKVELQREPLDLGDVVRNAVETARPLAETKQQTLRAELTPEPLPLDGDATRLEQVLSNLLRNAVKFTGPGGIIEVSARRNGTAEATVVVRDDGIGIAPDLLPRVFDLFAQGEQALDRSGAGLGIGLTLVRRLVEMHGGRVEARSDGPGKGSEFEVRLPLAPG